MGSVGGCFSSSTFFFPLLLPFFRSSSSRAFFFNKACIICTVLIMIEYKCTENSVILDFALLCNVIKTQE